MTPLRSTTLLLLSPALAGACGIPAMPGADEDRETTAAADASTGGGGSATSTTGRPPISTGTTV